MADKKEEGGAAGQSKPQEIPMVENLFAPEVYADEAFWFGMKSGNVCITFVSGRWDNNDSSNRLTRVVIGRLVLPLSGAQGLALGLYNYLEQSGVAPKLNESGKPAN